VVNRSAGCDAGGNALPDGQMEAFRALVWREGRSHWRELPWRGIDDDYAVLVSEVMLQQTQVSRVDGYWQRFLRHFPTIDALAAADSAMVLELWQGLGYNRRALMLKRCAEECSARHGGCLPGSYGELVALPGIGPTTAAGVLAFARNTPCVYLETNVRSVFLHHFFPDAQKVPDRLLVPLVQAACPPKDVRAWYYALLDYGAYLKTTVPNPSRRSSSYARQSAFEGSRRQKRSEIVRLVLGSPGIDIATLHEALNRAEEAAGRVPVTAEVFAGIVDDLVSEGFFRLQEERCMP
jgi:A/G-specific adenine glycosylase